jgi:hypothetical protein
LHAFILPLHLDIICLSEERAAMLSAVQYSGPPLESLKACVLDVKQPVAKRTVAAFHLRTLGTLEAALVIAEGKQTEKRTAPII